MPQGIVWWTPAEIAIRNKEDDLWVSFLGKVYDLTALAQKYDGKCTRLLPLTVNICNRTFVFAHCFLHSAATYYREVAVAVHARST